jgi:hypothetical protein
VLARVVRVDHPVLQRHVVPPEHEDLVAAGVVEAGDVVDEPVDADLGGLEALHGAQAALGLVTVAGMLLGF